MSGNLIYQISFALSEIYIISIFSTSEIGIFQLAVLFHSYLSISRLGIINAFNLEYPEAISLANKEGSCNILNTTKTHILFSSTFIFLFFLIYGLINDISFGFYLLFGVYLFIESFVGFEEAKKRSKLNFNFISKVKFISAFVVCLSIIFPLYFGLNGIAIRLIILQIFMYLLYTNFNFNFSLIKDFSFIEWKNLFNVGWKLWFWSYFKSFSKSFPKLLIVLFMSIETLGMFAPVQWVFSSFILFTSSISSFLYPKLIHMNNSNSKRSGTSYSLKITLYTFIFIAPFSIIGYYLIPFFFQQFLPQYMSSVNATQIVIFASLFEILALHSSSWISQKIWKTIFIYLFFIVIIRFLAMFFVYYFLTLNLINISYGILVSSILISLLTVFITYYEQKK